MEQKTDNSWQHFFVIRMPGFIPHICVKDKKNKKESVPEDAESSFNCEQRLICDWR
jgi:hypothetical protein